VTAAYLVDGQGPVYAPAVGYPAGPLHRAVVLPGNDGPWAGCGIRGRLDEDGLLFGDEADPARLCRRWCAGVSWNRGRGRAARRRAE
jgi:hypothetical protein